MIFQLAEKLHAQKAVKRHEEQEKQRHVVDLLARASEWIEWLAINNYIAENGWIIKKLTIKLIENLLYFVAQVVDICLTAIICF